MSERIVSRPTTSAYAEGWDAVWGRAPEVSTRSQRSGFCQACQWMTVNLTPCEVVTCACCGRILTE